MESAPLIATRVTLTFEQRILWRYLEQLGALARARTVSHILTLSTDIYLHMLLSIILAAVIIFCLLSCVTARRRRRRGFAPYRGTAWTLPRAQQGAPEPAPAYGAKDTQPYYPTTQPPAYEMNQQSANKDYGNNGVAENYAPPAGPPPAHTRPAA